MRMLVQLTSRGVAHVEGFMTLQTRCGQYIPWQVKRWRDDGRDISICRRCDPSSKRRKA